MGTISIGGLATGLKTNDIIDQLVALERRSVDLLEAQRLQAKAQQKALQTFNTKVLAFLTVVDKVRTADDVLGNRSEEQPLHAGPAVEADDDHVDAELFGDPADRGRDVADLHPLRHFRA